MQGFIQNIVGRAKTNTFFREVLENGQHTQIVIMSIPPGGEIGDEVHPDNDQILFLVEGTGKVILNGEEAHYSSGDIVLVRAGVRHNFINTGTSGLKIITTYSPPHHPDGTIHKTKAEAERAEY